MSFDRRQKTPRRPRYRFSGNRQIFAEIERSADQLPKLARVDLQDLSRSGYQFKTPVPLEIRELILLRLGIEDSGSQLALPSSVRWIRPANDGTWHVGCLTDLPIDWDALGELFLQGILSTDGPS